MLISSGIPGRPSVWHMADLTEDARWRQHGRGQYGPLQPVVAGTYTTLTFQFEIGATPIPTGGRLGVAWRWPIDWADLQTTDPQGDGYMTCSVTQKSAEAEPVDLEARYFQLGGFDPWHHHLELRVTQGVLTAGDQVTLICGDRSGGGPGWRAPTCRVKSIGFLMLIDPDQSDRWIRLPDAPSFPTIAGPPTRLVAIAPADGLVGETRHIIVRGEDRWGNVTLLPQDALRLQPASSDSSVDAVAIDTEPARSEDPPAYRFAVKFNEAGTYRLAASLPESDLVAESNPIYIHATPPAWRHFWGDLHSGQTEIGCGAGSMREHFVFARDAAGLQFATHQANDHYITRELWEQTHIETEACYEAGRFVTFLGCEWSALTEDGGDRNVIYRYDEPRLRRSGRFFTETEPDPEPDLTSASAFLEAMRHEPVLINMHVGGRPTNLDYHAPEIECLAEIHSTHGTSEWFVEDALSRGYKVGITAGTDGVAGRPGGCHPGWRLNRNVRNGLTAVYATDLTREALWEAFRARRCYGTTGERIALWVEVDGQPMGADYETSGLPTVKITVEGTAPLESVELLRGTKVFCRWEMGSSQHLPVDEAGRHKLRILWGGTQQRGTARAQRVVWDGLLRVSNGRIDTVTGVNLQSAVDGIQIDSPEQIGWRSATAGNRAGVVLHITGDDETVCHFATGPTSFDFRLSQVRLTPLVVDAGGLGRQVQVGPAPDDSWLRRAELTFCDTQPQSGEWPYWVRVTQIDQAKAWSSPVYVTHP